MIELLAVSKTFNAGRPNAFTAVKEIDLRIAKQRVTVFKGPSGSGKTTLLSLIGCMARPTSGRIRVDGRETTSLPERFAAAIRRTTFGFVFQNYRLIRGLSTLENVMLPAYPLGLKYRTVRQRAMALLGQLQIQDKARQKVEHLSGGERQRAAIARALINDPPVVIADEPTAHLDTDLANVFLEIVAQLKDAGKTVLIASHDSLVCQAPMVDRVVSMRDGCILGKEGVHRC